MRSAGFVLVGGRSSRMGQDKAMLSFRPETPLVAYVADQVHRVAGSVTLVGSASRYTNLDFECWDDLRPDHGPLGGLETVLTKTQAAYNLIVACDLPGVGVETLNALLSQALLQNAPSTVLRDVNGRVQPLCGVYHPICLDHIASALDSGDWKVMNVLNHLVPAYFDVPFAVENINEPADWRRFLKSAQAGSGSEIKVAATTGDGSIHQLPNVAKS